MPKEVGSPLLLINRQAACHYIYITIILVGVAELIKLKSELLCSEKELSDVLDNIRSIIPDVKIRVQCSYAWLIFVTLKVQNFPLKAEYFI